MRPQDVKLLAPTVFGPPPIGPNPTWIDNDYEDPCWIYTDIYDRQFALDFRTIAPNFRQLGKHLLWACEFITDRRLGQVRVSSVSSFVQIFTHFRKLAAVCHKDQVGSLMELSQEEFEESFARTVGRVGRQRKSLSEGALERFRSMHQRLYWLGPAGLGVLADGLSFCLPKNHRYLGIATHPEVGTALMPDQVAEDLLWNAIDFLQYGPAIIKCLEAEIAFRKTHGGRHSRIRCDVRSDRRLAYLRIRPDWKQIRGSARSLHRISNLTLFAKDFGVSNEKMTDERIVEIISYRYINTLHRHLIAACYCVVAGFSGFRCSEVLSMVDGDVFERSMRVFIRTRYFKGSAVRVGEPVERIAAPVVQRAFIIIEEAARAAGRRGHRVWVTNLGEPLIPQTIAMKVRDFLREVAGHTNWHFNTHQFRRYFAIFWVRRYQGSMDGLRRMFLHITHRAMEAYVRDPSLAKSLSEASAAFAREIVTDVVFGVGQYSMVPVLRAHRAHAQAVAETLPLELIESEVQKLIGESYLDVYANDWGYCMRQRDEYEGAVCGGKGSRPNEVEMHPANCAGCMFLALGKENRGFWVARKALHERVLASPLSLPALKRTSEAEVAKANVMIQRLDSLTGMSRVAEA